MTEPSQEAVELLARLLANIHIDLPGEQTYAEKHGLLKAVEDAETMVEGLRDNAKCACDYESPGPCETHKRKWDSALRAVKQRMQDECKTSHTVERQRVAALQMELDAICRENTRLEAEVQRTRLETILRYGWHVSGCNVWWRGNDTTWPTHDAYLRDPDCDCGLTQALVGSEIASLQPREAPPLTKQTPEDWKRWSGGGGNDGR